MIPGFSLSIFCFAGFQRSVRSQIKMQKTPSCVEKGETAYASRSPAEQRSALYSPGGLRPKPFGAWRGREANTCRPRLLHQVPLWNRNLREQGVPRKLLRNLRSQCLALSGESWLEELVAERRMRRPQFVVPARRNSVRQRL